MARTHRTTKTISLCIALVLCQVIATSQTVTNGSLTGLPANSGIVNGNAVGWSGCGFSADLLDVGFPSFFGGNTVTVCASPDGGSWLGLAAIPECAQTTITGLTVGQSYTLYFCGASFGTGGIFNDTPSNPQVCVGTTCQTFIIPMVACTWNPYSLPFTATATTMTLQIDHFVGSDGYASLDGFNLSAPCGGPAVTITNLAASICAGDSIFLAGDYQIAAGVYNDTLVDINGLDSILITTLTVVPLPVIDLGTDTSLCAGDTIILDANTLNASYLWQDGSITPVDTATLSDLYWVEVTVNGCSVRDSVLIAFTGCGVDLEIPNVFTPNGDGSNDSFVPIISDGVKSMRTTIYNRWGQVVFETSNPEIKWRAQDVPQGTYYWFVQYSDVDGRDYEKNGIVTVLK